MTHPSIPALVTMSCALLSAGFALACLVVLVRVLRAAEAQARAAGRQARASAQQNRQMLRPVLLCTGLRTLDEGRRVATIANRSAGVAIDIRWSDDDREPTFEQRANGPSLVLGPNTEMDVSFDAGRTTRLIFVYASIFEELARTEVLLIDDLWSNRYFPERL